MIGFNALGRMGRLANQMFQYASLKGIARNIGADICIPYYKSAVDDGIGNQLRTELFDSFTLDVNISLLNNLLLNEDTPVYPFLFLRAATAILPT